MRGHYANIAERAVGLTATVRVRGPDPRGDVAADAAFFAHHRPDDDHLPPVVAISATALRIPTRASTRWDGRSAAGDDRERFIAPLAPFLPFLAPRDRSSTTARARPLAPGVDVPSASAGGLGGDEPGGWTRARPRVVRPSGRVERRRRPRRPNGTRRPPKGMDRRRRRAS